MIILNTIRIYIYLIPVSIVLFGGPTIDRSNIVNEFSYFMNNTNSKTVEDTHKKKNPFLAVVLSGIVPGAGQIYSGNYKRGAIFLGVEIASLAYRSHYNKKGDNFVSKYKNFADEHWSFDKWIKDATTFSDEGHAIYDAMINIEDGEYIYPYNNSHHIEIELNGNTYKTNSNSFKNFYTTACSYAINNNSPCEQTENNPDNPDNTDNPDFFANAVVLKDHHFYEGIGKYDMFFAGWDDTEDCDDETINEEGSCSWIFESNNDIVAMSANKIYYQYELRDKANKNYDYAENALSLIFINHALSLFDSFIASYVKNRDRNFNYYTSPIYNYNNAYKIQGVNLSISW